MRRLHLESFHADGRDYHRKRVLLPEVSEASMTRPIAACLPDPKISVEKTGSFGPEKTLIRGSGLVFALDESGSDRAHVGRVLFVLVRPVDTPPSISSPNGNGAGPVRDPPRCCLVWRAGRAGSGLT